MANFGITFNVDELGKAMVYHALTLPLRDFILLIQFVADRVWLPLFRLITIKFDAFFNIDFNAPPPDLISYTEMWVRLIARFASVFYDLMVDIADASDSVLDLIQSKAPISILNQITNNKY